MTMLAHASSSAVKVEFLYIYPADAVLRVVGFDAVDFNARPNAVAPVRQWQRGQTTPELSPWFQPSESLAKMRSVQKQ
jgi:hypothetical protein